jgi:Fic family protein
MYAIEPLLPDVAALEPAILALTAEASALGSMLPVPTIASLAEVLRTVNTYHSNLIEGHDTRPRDILRAMAGDYSRDPERRALQLEARAHMEVQRLIEERLGAEPGLAVTSPAFLAWVHREFYERMPAEYRVVRSRSGGRESVVEPGAWRAEDVDVGRHVPPPHAEVPAYLERFHAGYDPARRSGLELVAAIPASHHRLLWIHPFLDGNGRVARLFTDAFLRRAGLGAHGLWTASRGLARARERYLALLEAADAERRGDYDGRGARSRLALTKFCAFFLETCVDQVRYMRSLLDPATLRERMRTWVHLRSTGGIGGTPLPADAWRLLDAALSRGELRRGEAARILGTSERTARRVLATLTREGLLVSRTPKGTVRLGFPVDALEYFFPLLAPNS